MKLSVVLCNLEDTYSVFRLYLLGILMFYYAS